jgi:protein-L-isoaspartate(D-aspartate) O-methyltransferase
MDLRIGRWEAGQKIVMKAYAQGWIVPSPEEPKKSRGGFEEERTSKVRWLERHDYLRFKRIRQALLKVPRKELIPRSYRDYAHLEVPLPLPGEEATISCPHSYALFYEPLGLDEGHTFLEVGLGSGYGAAIAQEIVGTDGLVVAIEIDPLTFEFAKRNLEKTGYDDIVVVKGDGGVWSSGDGSLWEIPPPLIEQLRTGGRLITPVMELGVQDLVLLEKSAGGIQKRVVCEVLYVSLRGNYGT